VKRLFKGEAYRLAGYGIQSYIKGRNFIMKRLCFCIFGLFGLFLIGGFANVLVFAAPPTSPELRRYQPHLQYHPQPAYNFPHSRIVQPNGGITYPLSATVVEPDNVEYAAAPQLPVQMLPTERIPVIRSRSGRYYTIAPTITAETIETTEPTSESLIIESPPMLAPPLQPQELQPPPQTKNSQQPIAAPPSFRSPNINSEKNIAQNTTNTTPPKLDVLNARLAKMQLEKKNLDGTLRSIDKIEDVAFKVQTLVDLAEYVSRDKNYKKEADYLLNLALTATDDFARKRPVIITFPDNNSKPDTTITTTPIRTTPKPTKRPALTETPPNDPVVPPSDPIENTPKTIENEDEYLYDPQPKNTNKTKNDIPKLDTVPELTPTIPSPIERERTNKIENDGLESTPNVERTLSEIVPPTNKPSTTLTPKNTPNKIVDADVTPDVEESVIVQPKPRRERTPLITPNESLPSLDNGNETEKKDNRQPPTIKLPEASKMTFEDYKKLNEIQSTPNAAAEKNIDTPKNDTEKSIDENQIKKKPIRPKKKPLTQVN
jgi:hypothetical protein